MVKSIFVYTIVFFFLFLVSFSLHEYFLEKKEIFLPFSLQKVYVFHLGYSLLVCTNFLIFSNVNKVSEQLGFIYLGTIMLKLILFSILFYKHLFVEDSLLFAAKISLLIPMILFLLTEVVFVSKILNKKQY